MLIPIIHACQTVKSTVKLKARYENGEEGCVQVNKVEPKDEDFESPKQGDEVCCRVGGTRYSATILQVLTSNSTSGAKQV